MPWNQRASRRAPRRRDERGGVAVFVAPMVVVIVAAAAFVTDLGLQRVLRSDLQAVADVVALDLARNLDGRTAAQLATTMNTARDQSVARNHDAVGNAPQVTYELGEVTLQGTFRRFGTSGTDATAAPTAVRAIAVSEVRYPFTGGDGASRRTAVAGATSSACYTVGSYAAMVQSGNSALLNPILRRIGQSNATLTAADYTGLVGTQVKLDTLAANLGLGSVNQLATTTVQAKDFYVALVNALPAGTNPTHVAILNQLRSWTLWMNATIQLGRLLGISSGSGAVVGATYNLLDLVAGSMFLVNGENLIYSSLGASLPGVINLGIQQLKVIQGPRQYCGRPGTQQTTARPTDTQQLGLHVDASFGNAVTSIQVPGIPGIIDSPLSLTVHQPNWVGLDIGLAPTTSTLTSLSCADHRSASFDVTNGLVTIKITTPIRTSLRMKVKLLGMLSLAEIQVDVNLTVDATVTIARNGVRGMTIEVPPRAFDTAYPTSTGQVTIVPVPVASPNVSAHLTSGLGLGAWVDLSTTDKNRFATSAINSALGSYFDLASPNSLVNQLVNPILGLAGAELAGSRISLNSTPGMQCGTPKLQG